MSDLNCELMGKFKVFLLGVPLALGVLAGCSEEVEYEMPIYDFVNPSVCFFVSDAATGVICSIPMSLMRFSAGPSP